MEREIINTVVLLITQHDGEARVAKLDDKFLTTA